jgi:allantoin racemase
MDTFNVQSRADEAGAVQKVRLLLLNPNTTVATTEMMLRIARDIAGPDVQIEGMTAPFGPALITNESELAVAADAVVSALADLPGNAPDGIIIAAFGDPALETVRGGMWEIVGIAEASMAEAASGGRSFSVATTTPHLAAAIRRCAERYGHGDQLLSVRVTQGDPGRTMADASELLQALEAAAILAIKEDGAEAIIIGGGPLADAARGLSERIGVPVIEPIPAALRLLETRRREAP